MSQVTSISCLIVASIWEFFFSLRLWLSWLSPASPQRTAHCPLASGTRGGEVAANKSATRHPEGIELDPFHVSGSSDSCCSMEMEEKRDPIKVPSPASFQQPMPQCPPLSSPDSSVRVVFFTSQSPLAPKHLQLETQSHFSERWAWENS